MELNIKKDGFRQSNTSGYSQAELDKLNEELQLRLNDVNDEDHDSYYTIIKSFNDEVARR